MLIFSYNLNLESFLTESDVEKGLFQSESLSCPIIPIMDHTRNSYRVDFAANFPFFLPKKQDKLRIKQQQPGCALRWAQLGEKSSFFTQSLLLQHPLSHGSAANKAELQQQAELISDGSCENNPANYAAVIT